MAERQIIVHCTNGKWSAVYSDRPEECAEGVTMQDAIDRLTAQRSDDPSDPADVDFPGRMPTIHLDDPSTA